MAYCNNPESDEPVFCLFDIIGCNEANPMKPYVDGNQFAKELMYMDGEGKKRIQIWINSEGGNIKDGFSIIAAILKSKTKVDTFTIGVAYSMSGVIAMMGRRREALSTASFMLHLGYNPDGTEDKGLDVLNKSLITGVAERWGKSEEYVRGILEAETFYTAREAEEAGMIDEVVPVSDLNQPRKVTDVKAQKEFASQYVNKFLTKKDTMNKDEICTLLGLDSKTTTEAQAMAALTAFHAKATTALKAQAKKAEDDEDDEEDSAPVKSKKAKAETEEMKALKASVAEMKLSLETKATEEKASKETAAKAEAKAAITSLVAKRKLTLDDAVVEKYVALAGTDADKLKSTLELIEAIPMTTKAAVIKSVNKDAADTIGIALIPSGATEENSPIGVAAGDTSATVAGINGFNFHKNWTNRKRA